MDHVLAASFFTLVFLGAGAALQGIVRQYRTEIAAALRGEHAVRPTVYRYRAVVRPTVLPLPAVASRPMRSAF